MAVPGYFRKPFGPGWALVGDAGYNKDFITAQGIQDAFRDAEMCVRALDEAYSGRRPFQEAMADEFIGVVTESMGRPVLGYHSQLTLEPDIGFEFFVLEEQGS